MTTGILLIMLNTYWIWFHVDLWYSYHYSGMLFLFMYPDWILFLNSIFGLIGVIMGIGILWNKITVKFGLIINFIVILIGLLILFS